MGALSDRIARVRPDPKRPEPPKPVVDERPTWLRRRDEGLLRAKVFST